MATRGAREFGCASHQLRGKLFGLVEIVQLQQTTPIISCLKFSGPSRPRLQDCEYVLGHFMAILVSTASPPSKA
ncbi:hypothetical protein MRX96_058195 [Rhipicephalus microplus]